MINGRSGPIYASSLSLCFWNLAFTSSAQIIRSNQDHRPKQFSQNKYRLWKFCGGEGGWSAAAAGSWGGREERHPASNPQASLVILSNNSHFLFHGWYMSQNANLKLPLMFIWFWNTAKIVGSVVIGQILYCINWLDWLNYECVLFWSPVLSTMSELPGLFKLSILSNVVYKYKYISKYSRKD